MNYLYPDHKTFSSFVKAALILLITLVNVGAANAQTTTPELDFSNASLEPNTASNGADGAIYRFPAVKSGVDALVKINGRSSSLVKLDNIDIANTGFDKAFQPQVTYNNGSTNGAADWWMEFQISFVKAGTTTATTVSSFNVTTVDNDGNGDKLNEYVSLYQLTSYTNGKNTLVTVSNLLDDILSLLTPGKKFNGPVTNFADIDTSATAVMTTSQYNNINSFIVRTGAHATGATGATNRMYSLYFKGFTYPAQQSFLPVTMINWNATYNNNTVLLKWTTTVEQNASHFIIERSTDGIDYTDAAMIVAAGNSEVLTNYSFKDKIPAGSSGILYYRLRSVDMDGTAKVSAVIMVRIGAAASTNVKIMTYPNPVVSELRITVPQNWQDKAVTYQLMNTSGQTIKTMSTGHAGQTATMSMAQVPSGIYIMKVTCGNETGVQSIMK